MLAENSKYIDGFEGKYSVTDDGRVYSHSRVDQFGRLFKGRWLKLQIDKDGYKTVNLCTENRKNKKFRVCRLVAMAFINNPENKPVINHKNGIKSDDRVSNLEWVTVKENTQHAWKNNLCKPYDRSKDYNRSGIIESNKSRKKWHGTKQEYNKLYYIKVMQEGKNNIYE